MAWTTSFNILVALDFGYIGKLGLCLKYKKFQMYKTKYDLNCEYQKNLVTFYLCNVQLNVTFEKYLK